MFEIKPQLVINTIKIFLDNRKF